MNLRHCNGERSACPLGSAEKSCVYLHFATVRADCNEAFGTDRARRSHAQACELGQRPFRLERTGRSMSLAPGFPVVDDETRSALAVR
jgi:hypothetical protein